jgi:hypothetical protein
MALGISTLCVAQQGGLHVPASVEAGGQATVPTEGSGMGTFYLLGPSESIKQDITLGKEIQLSPEQLRSAGRYVAVVCGGSCQSAAFFVVPAKAGVLSLLVHPSRVPVGQPDAISAVVFPFDRFNNLVLGPVPVDFRMSLNNADMMSRSMQTQHGVAWLRTASIGRAGTLQVVVQSGDVSARRVVQQVAAEACNLRVKLENSPKGVVAETEPVRDCSGNPLPDGTIVTFRETGPKGVSTVDAPVKKGVARAQMDASGGAVISVASGVVMGNEVRVGGKP